MYTLNEGQFIAPPPTWKDTTMNVFRDPDSPRTLVVARAEMTTGNTLEEELTLQCQQLQQVATNISIAPFEKVDLLAAPHVEALETDIRFFRNGGQYYQRQLAILQPDKKRILLFSYTSAAPFDDTDNTYWQELKHSFTLNG
ncbi:DcrB-related protein [Providencia stuartii]|uniref:DcrB-related protein n=1 Tax=Providencia stuartii TaxID=588 RepID=UPI00076AFCBF|nr:DcrB-related protein [Providencia stuartii]SUC45594.1 Uncharacterized conserved protein [Providencia stuartii]HEM8216965.1 DcrB-related protein [Providencia stuartii]